MQFAFDSRDNHMKLSSTDSDIISVPAFTFDQPNTLQTHSLGYRPNVRGYYEFDGDVWPVSSRFWTGKPDLRSSLNTTDSLLSINSSNFDFADASPTVYTRAYEEGTAGNTGMAFSSNKRIEKILAGPITGSFSATGGDTQTTETITNPTGSRQFTLMRWSLDGENWVDQDVAQYEYIAPFFYVVSALAHCTDSQIKIEAFNGYAGSKTVYYQVWLMQYEYDNIILDSRKKTLLNFDEGLATIDISGTINAGEIKEWETSFTKDSDAMGVWYVTRSDVPSVEYQYPYSELDFRFTASNLSLVTFILYEPSRVRIKARLWNTSGTNRTISSTTITYRYALFKV